MVSPYRDGTWPSFIAAQVVHLPARLTTVSALDYYQFTANGHPLVKYPSNERKGLLPWLRRTTSKNALLMDALTALLKEQSAQVVLGQFGYAAMRMVEPCRRLGIPLVAHFHGVDAWGDEYIVHHRKDYDALFAAGAAFIAVSRDMQRQLVDLGAPAERVHYSPYGIDVDLFSGAKPGEAPPHFVAVGRFVEKKSPHLTILAFSKVLKEVPDARLCMIGDGPLLDASRQQARALGIEHAVSMPGRLEAAQIAERLRSSRAFVQHSVRAGDGDSEGTPLAILEAGASGIPVISTRHAGIRDAVVEGETGLLVDEFDVENMAKHWIAVAKDPSLAERMGLAARQHIRQSFNQRDWIARLWKIIEDAIASYAAK